MLGFVAPSVPNGEVLEEAREANPEPANFDEEFCDLSPNPLPNVGFCEDSAGGVLDDSVSEDGGLGWFVISAVDTTCRRYN